MAMTALEVKRLATDGRHAVGGVPGLYLYIRGNSKTWILRVKVGEQRADLSIGSYADLPLADARQKAAQIRTDIAKGGNPLADRDKAKQAAKAAKVEAVTFKAAAAEYIEAHRPGWKNKKHAQQWENTLRDYAGPVIGELRVADVTTDHLLRILSPIWIAKAETAGRVRNRIELILDAAKAKGQRSGENPARLRGHLALLLPKQNKAAAVVHHPALPWPELPAFMAALNNAQGAGARVLEFVILTACRVGEAVNARWDEIDEHAKTWTIPAARMKANREHVIPLSDAALALLARLKADNRPSPFVYPSKHIDADHVSEAAPHTALRRLGYEPGRVTVHGFRSTFRDWAAETTNHSREAIELALAHKVAMGAEAAYWRGSMLEKRAALMQEWADYATGKQSGNNVIPMVRAKA